MSEEMQLMFQKACISVFYKMWSLYSLFDIKKG